MNPPFRRSRTSPPDSVWPASRPTPLRKDGTPAPRRDAAPASTHPTPLDLFSGLEINEIDSESVFDRYFGKAPAPAPVKR